MVPHCHSPLVEEPLPDAVHVAVVDEVRHPIERPDVAAAALRVSGCHVTKAMHMYHRKPTKASKETKLKPSRQANFSHLCTWKVSDAKHKKRMTGFGIAAQDKIEYTMNTI